MGPRMGDVLVPICPACGSPDVREVVVHDLRAEDHARVECRCLECGQTVEDGTGY